MFPYHEKIRILNDRDTFFVSETTKYSGEKVPQYLSETTSIVKYGYLRRIVGGCEMERRGSAIDKLDQDMQWGVVEVLDCYTVSLALTIFTKISSV